MALTDKNDKLSLPNKRVAENLAAFRDQAIKNKLEAANNASIILALKDMIKETKKENRAARASLLRSLALSCKSC